MLEIFNFFLKNISQILKEKLGDKPIEEINSLEEIRIRINGSIILKFIEKQEVLHKKVVYQDIIETLQIMCNNSIYSYQNEIKNGYITVKGGHRVGIAGNCIMENEKIININFRDKKYGYFGTNVKIYFKDGKVLEDCRDAKIFLKTMFSHIGLRPSCYNCPFRNYTRKCDFTLGDFWEIGSYSKKLDDNKGTTKITIYTEKGKRLFESANKNSDFIAIDEDISIKEKNMKIPKSRNEFFIDAKKIDFEENMKKYFHVEKKDFIANNIKPLVIHIPGIKLVIKMLRLKSIKRNLSRKD